MMQRRFAAIVEGHAERESVPLLLRRIHGAAGNLVFPSIAKQDVLRIPKSKLVRPTELERSIELAARRVGPDGAVLVLLDADDDRTCELGPALLARARQQRPAMRVGVVIANREFESWFLASATTLAIGDESVEHAAEKPRDTKGKIREVLRTYSPVVDQPTLTAKMDFASARSHSPSFDKLSREVCEVLSPSG